MRAGNIDAIYGFGDSLSDAGNVFTATGGTIPGPPYVNGQFSNGPVWVQDLAAGLGLAPLTPSLQGGTDYAYGSGQTGTTVFHTATPLDLTGAGGQVAQFQLAHPTADPNALYTIWIGSDDLGAVPSGATSAQVTADIGAAVANIDSAVGALAAEGAMRFLVLTVPNLGWTPEAIAAGAIAQAEASVLSASFDNTLVNGAGAIPSLAAIAGAHGLDLSVLDTYSLLDSVVANPARYGLTDVTNPCLTGSVNYAGGTPCASPNQYLFWDSIHPTAAGHAIVADAALEQVTPEPAAASMVVGGLLAMALVFRLRRV